MSCLGAALLVALLGGGEWLARAFACGGDPPPPRCAKTLVFSVGVPGPIKASDEPTGLELPGYLFLNLIEIPPGSGVCPRPPYAARISLRLECPGDAPVESTIDIPSIPVGHNRIPLRVVVPPGGPRKCLLTAKATITFSDGMRISRTTRQCICVVDCSEKDPSLPRLDLSPVVANTEIASVHPGDQTSFRYKIANNDPDETFRGILRVVSVNESRRPTDESTVPAAPGTGVFGLADELGDAFPVAFREDIEEACIILPTEPQRVVESTRGRVLVLGPCEMVEVEVVTRPWGMCADGSCSQLTVTVDGRFTDDTPGLACAGAVAVADSGERPRYVWPDSGKVATVTPLRDRLVIEGEPTPTGRAVVETEMVSLSLTSAEPIPLESQTEVWPLGNPDVTQQPEKGRFETSVFPQEPVRFNVDSFFDIVIDLDLGPQKPVSPVVEGMSRIPGAPAGFERSAPLAMGVLRAPMGPEFQVDSFFDVTYQISGQASGRDVSGKPVDFRVVFEDLVFDPAGARLVVAARVRLLLPAIQAGAGAGLPVGEFLLDELVLRQDLAAFARLGVAPPCPAPEIVDLRCLPQNDGVCLVWGIQPASCACDRIVIEDAAGEVLAVLPGDATTVCLPCERLGAPQGTLAVVCLDENGEPVSRAVCEYDCRPCPRLEILRCTVVDGVLYLGWAPLGDGCCDRILIRHQETGEILAALPPDVGSARVPCPELPRLTGTVCIECIDVDGNVLDRACCDYRCPDPCPPDFQAVCDQTANGVVIAWSDLPAECCAEYAVYLPNDPASILEVLPAGTSFVDYTCERLAAIGAPPVGSICIDCVAPDGSRRQMICCDYACPDPCPPDLRGVCDPTGNGLAIAWSQVGPECCRDFVVYSPDDPDAIVQTLPPGTSFVEYTCEQLDALGLPRSGTICIDCRDPAGNRRRVVCCEYDCPDPCPPSFEAVCDPTGDGFAVAWAPVGNACCERFVVYEAGDPATILLSLPGGTSFADFTCDRLRAIGAPDAGLLCIDCVHPDGRRERIICCEYDCRPECPPFEVECSFDGAMLRMTWPNMPADCCERYELFDAANPGVILRTLPAGTTGVDLGCDELLALTGRRAGTLCVQCVAPDGTTVRRCCDYDCPPDCPPLEVRCEIVDGANGPLLRATWTPPGDECCDGMRIFIDGVQVGAVAPDAGVFSIPCTPEIPESGVLCVRCYRGGEPVDEACCDYVCPPCPDLDVRCEIVENANGAFLRATWTPPGARCCDGLRIFVNDQQVGALPPDAGVFSIPCAEIPENGTLCVRCYREGEVVDESCCEYECPPDECPPFELLRCEMVNGGVLLTWSPMPERCCDRFIVRDGNQVELDVLPAGTTMYSISCERLVELTGAEVGMICVYCVAPDGTETRICCDYDCREDPTGGQLPGDCNQDGRLDLSDAVCLLGHLFLGAPPRLPCGDGDSTDPANVALLDWNGDLRLDIADPISELQYLFVGGRPHVLGRECVPIRGCPEVCTVP